MMAIGGIFAFVGSRYTANAAASRWISVVGVLAVLYGAYLFIRRDRVGDLTLRIGLALGSMMIVAIVAATDNLAAVGAGAGFMVWVALYSACFLPLRLAIAYVAGSLALLALAIAVFHPQQLFVAFGSAAVNTVIVMLCTGWMAAQLRDLAVTDGLTGLVNASAFHNTLRIEVERARRHGGALSVVFIDIDGLKLANDRDGHRAGDAMIVAVADAIRAEIRSGDTAARTGGDEFAITLPDTDAVAALRLVERISSRHGARFSAGVSELVDGDTPGHLLTRADEAMYRQKAEHRSMMTEQCRPAVAAQAATGADPKR